MTAERTSSGSLNVRLRTPEKRVTLAQVWRLADRFQRALSELASQLAGDSDSQVVFEVTEAKVGSLDLAVRAVALAPVAPDPDTVLATFAEDLDWIRNQRFRPGMTAALLSTYQKLVRDFTTRQETIEISYRDQAVKIDKQYEVSLEVALKEKVASEIVIAGYLDAVLAHKPPFAFYLYPKLDQAHRIECRFPEALRAAVADVLKQRSVVRVSGTGYFGPIGIYPNRIDVDQAPERLAWNPEAFLALLGSLPIVPKGVSVADFLDRSRRALEFGE
jgi:hypothetical protein